MCGIAGVFNSFRASELVLLEIYSLQHRGQESVGISSSDGNTVRTVRRGGRVLEGIKREDISYLKGHIAIAHVRYSTAGESGEANAQPLFRETDLGPVAVAHNGNIVNYEALRKELEHRGIRFEHSSDTELFLALLSTGNTLLPEGLELHPRDEYILPRLFYALSRMEGAYSFLMLLRDRLIAGRDPFGFRPLSVGRKGKTILLASESCAFHTVEGELWRELMPGEVMVLDEAGIRSYFPFKCEHLAQCVFELIYFSRPDSLVFGDWVYRVREELGRQLAREDDVEADVVIPVPDSGLVPALGYAKERGLPFELGLIRNHYVGRSFIEPTQELRNLRVLMKLSPNRAVVEGKRVVVVDDSLVRGTTSKKIMAMLRSGGAKEIHMRVASPPVIGPCYFGIDTPTKEELIANRMSVEEIREFIGVDSLRYLSLEGLKKCVKKYESFCDACFSNRYPVEIGQPVELIPGEDL